MAEGTDAELAGASAGSRVGHRPELTGYPLPGDVRPTLADFEPRAGDRPAARSGAYDPQRPHQFEGLEPRFPVRTIRSVFIPMRDGVRLSTDFHIPLGASLPLPVVLSRTPYSKRKSAPAFPHIFPEQGFVFAVQDVRGRHESEGAFVACSAADRDDGYDTVDWIASQPWCSGAIGAIGSSYVGETAGKLAATLHPAHRANVMLFDGSYAGGQDWNGAFLQGGVSLLRMLFQWFRNYVPRHSLGPPAGVERAAWFQQPYAQAYATQPVAQPPVDEAVALSLLPVADILDRTGAAPSDFAEMMRRADDLTDPYWRGQGFITQADRIDVPTLHVTGPQERGGSGPDNFNLFPRIGVSARARENQRLIFSPCPHSGFGGGDEHTVWGARDFGDTRFPYYRTFVEWFGCWLRGDDNGGAAPPKVRAFVAGANVWREFDAWPPADAAPTALHLRGDGRLTPEPPPMPEAEARYTYDPADPTPSEPPDSELDTLGGGYGDRSTLEGRADILVYTSAPLPAAIEVAGRVEVVLHVSSSAPDTDFVAVLMEVDAEGRAINVTQGVARARYREGLHRKVSMSPAEVYELRIDLWHACIRFDAGRRLRLHVASSHFPFYDRNLNTGGDNFTDTEFRTANNAVHHGPTHPSRLILPVRRA